MWVRRAAIRPIAPYARLSAQVLDRVEERLAGDDKESEKTLEQAFARFEKTQPALSTRMAIALGRPMGETALALGYFLSLAIWLAFEQAFAARLGELSDEELDATSQSLVLDEDLRKNAPDEAVETDDVVAMEQPEVVQFIRDHIDVALETHGSTGVEIEEVDTIYRLILLEVVALSHAVKAPEHHQVVKNEWQA